MVILRTPLPMDKANITSEKVIKIILGLFIAAYSLLAFRIYVLMAYTPSNIAYAPTIECEAPQNLNEILKCAGIELKHNE